MRYVLYNEKGDVFSTWPGPHYPLIRNSIRVYVDFPLRAPREGRLHMSTLRHTQLGSTGDRATAMNDQPAAANKLAHSPPSGECAYLICGLCAIAQPQVAL